jgi:mono/diheme cytochrome c family protein
MSPRFLTLTARLVLAAAPLWLSACGGGDEGGDAAYAASTGTATPSAVVIGSGKALYAQHCQGCHGANMPSAKNYANTLSAIAGNRGGMAALANSVKTPEADAIAAYLAFGL